MLRDLDVKRYPRIYIVCGYTDLRMGLSRLVDKIRFDYKLDVYDRGSLFLFAGRKGSTIKALCFEGDGMLIMTKYISRGRFQWPRTPEEVKQITGDQFKMLMNGFTIVSTIENDGSEAI